MPYSDNSDDLQDFFRYVNKLNELETHTVLMQFTGLQDKNRRDIYEGDIVRYRDDYGTECTEPVVYSNEMALFYLKGPVAPGEPVGHWMFFHEIPEDYLYEVVGNIYENPELIDS